jgi:hypothetical protein
LTLQSCRSIQLFKAAINTQQALLGSLETTAFGVPLQVFEAAESTQRAISHGRLKTYRSVGLNGLRGSAMNLAQNVEADELAQGFQRLVRVAGESSCCERGTVGDESGLPGGEDGSLSLSMERKFHPLFMTHENLTSPP